MPRGIPNAKQPGNDIAAMEAANLASLPPVDVYDPYSPRHVPEPEPEGPRMARVRLERNYCPINPFSIVGHTRPEIKKKNPAGREEIFQTEEWIPDQMMPPAIAGTGFKDKVWAGTVIELPESEAKTIVKQKIGSLEFAD
jgi:hypothetical protein